MSPRLKPRIPRTRGFPTWWAVAAFLLAGLVPAPALAQPPDSSPQSRGTGLPTSMFGTYIRKGDLLIYPFFEYYHDRNFEYKPAELGYGLNRDFRGRYRASEGILFLGLGLTDWLAVELQAAVISATLHAAVNDTSGIPGRIRQSGRGDVEGQVRLRWARETARRPEVFSYFEAVSPSNRQKRLIGTPDWEFKFGTGLVRGFSWGTMTFRAAIDYSADESAFAIGEYAIEYLRRLSPSWRLYLGLEGSEDEVSAIGEVQVRLAKGVILKLNNGIGLTSKATDWAPEIGLLMSVPVARRSR